MKKSIFDGDLIKNGGLVKASPIRLIPMNFDYASLYPRTFHLSDKMKQKIRRSKLDKILNNINDENII